MFLLLTQPITIKYNTISHELQAFFCNFNTTNVFMQAKICLPRLELLLAFNRDFSYNRNCFG